MRRIINFYKKFSKRHLTLVQSLETGMLMCTGDLIAQTQFEDKRAKDLDLRRTANFFIIGSGLVGPALSLWYKCLARTVGTTGTGTVVLKKVAVDQLIFAPTFLVIFIFALNTLEGHSLEHIKQELKFKYKDIILTNYTVWPFIQIVNFYFMPLRYQVLLVQSVAILWNAYLSWKSAQVVTNDE